MEVAKPSFVLGPTKQLTAIYQIQPPKKFPLFYVWLQGLKTESYLLCPQVIALPSAWHILMNLTGLMGLPHCTH